MRDDATQPPVYDHTDEVAEVGFEPDADLGEARTAHLREHLAGEPRVVPVGGPIEMLLFAPTPERPMHTLVTHGVSDRAGDVPEGAEAFRRIELVAVLPEDWPLPASDDEWPDFLADPARSWPVELVFGLAHLPSTFDSWLGWGHTATADSDPRATYDGSPFGGVLLGSPVTLPEEFETLAVGDQEIAYLGVYPLYAAELDFKLAHGAEELLARFDEAGVPEVALTDRPPLVEPEPRRRRFGLLRRR